MHRPKPTKCRFYRKESLIFEREREGGGGVIYENGVSYKLNSFLESQNLKASFYSGLPALRRRPRPHGSIETPRTFAIARRHPRLQNPRTDSKGLNPRSRNQRKHEEKFSENSPQGGGRKMAETHHSGHEMDSKRKHSNHPPLGNKNPNS